VRSKKSVPKPILVETVRRSVITQVEQVAFV
jgi:hypothetical protein